MIFSSATELIANFSSSVCDKNTSSVSMLVFFFRVKVEPAGFMRTANFYDERDNLVATIDQWADKSVIAISPLGNFGRDIAYI